MVRALRAYFDERDFIEVETATVVSSPGQELHLEALEVLGADGKRWLHTSPEYQMKRLLAEGLPRIYQLCKAYRRGEKGQFHEPEFSMLEWYRRDSGSEDMMRDTEALVASAALAVVGDTRVPGVEGPVDLQAPWERLTVAQAFERHARCSLEAVVQDEDAYYRTLIEEVEPRLGRGRPTFLTHYPASMASLARLRPEDPSLADRFEAYVDGVELCNGFGELTDSVEQRKRFEAERDARRRLGKPLYPIDERLLTALDSLPPSGGNALGVDRLLMLIVGAKTIHEVMAFATDTV